MWADNTCNRSSIYKLQCLPPESATHCTVGRLKHLGSKDLEKVATYERVGTERVSKYRLFCTMPRSPIESVRRFEKRSNNQGLRESRGNNNGSCISMQPLIHSAVLVTKSSGSKYEYAARRTMGQAKIVRGKVSKDDFREARSA